nr:immunoglobulin heavy chain junction region [Macaca mulatta]MOV43774.1 immunoglobulin heavy chain junction region [Macaca mulatta]MOV44599.1 immunoglobulin heavy chain junction region [Macaca mulatta]
CARDKEFINLYFYALDSW